MTTRLVNDNRTIVQLENLCDLSMSICRLGSISIHDLSINLTNGFKICPGTFQNFQNCFSGAYFSQKPGKLACNLKMNIKKVIRSSVHLSPRVHSTVVHRVFVQLKDLFSWTSLWITDPSLSLILYLSVCVCWSMCMVPLLSSWAYTADCEVYGDQR